MTDKAGHATSEPRVRCEVTPGVPRSARPARAVHVVLPLDWAQAVRRLQQLHNEGYSLVRLTHDEQGQVRIEPQ
jgi:hypothetical protein